MTLPLVVNWASACGVVIPCFNEAATIPTLLPEVRRQLPTVAVVDDGSTDQTAELASSHGATVLRHSCREGKGAALATGLQWLHQRHMPWALLMDGDGQHAPADIPVFLRRAEQSAADLILGNRMAQPGQMPWVRRRVNRWMSARLSKLAGRSLPDSQCGFRLLKLARWAELELKTAHFEVESELLLAFLQFGAAVEFVPIRVIYSGERTKISPWLDGWRWLRWFWHAQRAWRSPCPTQPKPGHTLR